MPRTHIAARPVADPAAPQTIPGAARRVGNRSMGALIKRMRSLETPPSGPGRLSVRPPDDRFERQAHRVADRPRGRAGPPPRFEGAPGRASGGRPLDVETSRTIESRRGAGSRLPDRIRRTLEPELGVDLSPIRIQADTAARSLTRAVGARAMTVGRTIWIGESGFSPDTRSGRETLRHEVTHALQQSGVRRRPGRKTGEMGVPSSVAVQCLMTSGQLRLFGGSASFAVRGSKRYQKILDKLDAYHSTTSTAVKTRRLGKIARLVDDFISANESTAQPVKRRKLAAVRDLKRQVLFEKGDEKTDSTWSLKIQERKGVHDSGTSSMPTSVEGTRYKFTMHSHIGHRRYTDFAKERAGLRRNNVGRWMTFRDKKSNDAMKREAATTVADRFESDWKVKGDKKGEQSRKRSAYIRNLIKSSGSVGHAWVSFHTESKEGAASEPLSFGFWPLVNTTGFGVDTPGNVHHPDNRYKSHNTRTRTDTVSYRQWKRGLTTCYDVLKSPPMYELTGTNCTTFTRDIARKVGVGFPSAYWVAPNLSAIWNPNDLYDTFKD